MADGDGKEPGGEPMTVEQVKALLAEVRKGGGALEAKLADVLEDNAKLRARNRALREAPQLKPGEVVLDAEDAKLWERYRKLGEPSEISKAMEGGELAGRELAELRRAETYRQAAQLLNWKPGTFARFARADGLEITIEEGEKDGKPVRAAYVMGEGDKKTPLAKYAEAHWVDDLPDLKADPNSNPLAPPPPGRPPRERRSGPPPAPGRGTEDEIYADQLELVQYRPL